MENSLKQEEFLLILQRLNDLVDTYCDIFCSDQEYLQGFLYDNEIISITTESYCCGSSSTESYDIPISYLWTDDWVGVEKEAQAQRRKAYQQAEDKRKAESARLTEEQERKKYKELQEKYG